MIAFAIFLHLQLVQFFWRRELVFTVFTTWIA